MLRLMKRISGEKGLARIYWDSDMVEYSVKLNGFPEDCDYFTDDWEDAVATAIKMVEHDSTTGDVL